MQNSDENIVVVDKLRNKAATVVTFKYKTVGGEGGFKFIPVTAYCDVTKENLRKAYTDCCYTDTADAFSEWKTAVINFRTDFAAADGNYFGLYFEPLGNDVTVFIDDVTVTQAERLAGDCNGDAEFDVRDLARLKKYMSGMDVEIYEGADYDKSGTLDALDLVKLKKVLAGITLKDDWRNHPEDYTLVAFTFDDAPYAATDSNNITTTIIDTLNKYDGRGTLFVNGSKIDAYGTKLLKYGLDHGFEIGNHTYNHLEMSKISEAEVYNEITRVNDLVEEKLGVIPKFLRPGYVDCGGSVMKVATDTYMPCIGNTLFIGDYDYSYSADYVKNAALTASTMSDGVIVLMHSWSETTVAVIDEVCAEMYENGCRFVTLSELFEMRGIETVPTDTLINYVL